MSVEFNIAKDAPIHIAGHKGLMGGELWQHFSLNGYTNPIGWNSQELDLRDRAAWK